MSKNRVQSIIKEIFDLQTELKQLAPAFNWGGLGNLLGDYGEYMSLLLYNLDPVPTGTKNYDALTKDGHTVQVKTNRLASQIGFRGVADLLLVVHVNEDASIEEIYFGPADIVLEQARYSERDNKNMIAISKLKDLRERVKQLNLDNFLHKSDVNNTRNNQV